MIIPSNNNSSDTSNFNLNTFDQSNDCTYYQNEGYIDQNNCLLPLYYEPRFLSIFLSTFNFFPFLTPVNMSAQTLN